MGGFCLLQGEALQEDPMHSCTLNPHGQALRLLAAVTSASACLGSAPMGTFRLQASLLAWQ